MWWWVGAVLSMVLAMAWALGLSVVVSRGEKHVWAFDVAPWYVGLHGGAGLLALWMIMQTVG